MKITQEQAYQLKDKFYAATATPEEERLLARLLHSEECPKEWTTDERRALMALLPDDATALPEGFALRLATRLEQERLATRRTVRLRLFRWSAAAAMIAVAFGSLAFWHLSLTSADEQITTVEQTKGKAPSAEVIPIAPPAEPTIAETASPQVNKKKPMPASRPKQQRLRSKSKVYVADKGVAPVPSAATTIEQQTPPPSSGISAVTTQSLNDHLQRTMQSRDRLIAEARNYMAGSCLNRSMPPHETTTTETEK